jgi:hypothetical protein
MMIATAAAVVITAVIVSVVAVAMAVWRASVVAAIGTVGPPIIAAIVPVIIAAAQKQSANGQRGEHGGLLDQVSLLSLLRLRDAAWWSLRAQKHWPLSAICPPAAAAGRASDSQYWNWVLIYHEPPQGC